VYGMSDDTVLYDEGAGSSRLRLLSIHRDNGERVLLLVQGETGPTQLFLTEKQAASLAQALLAAVSPK
jgi:hypothetical protein